MAQVVNIHATCVLLGRAGVAFGAPATCGILLLGKSGAGKSDVALRLIALGARLVSDDRTDLFLERSKLFARAPKRIAGLIEARGLGVIALAVSLERPKSRLPLREIYQAPLGLSAAVPLIRLAPFEASTPAKIALAAAAFENNRFRESVLS